MVYNDHAEFVSKTSNHCVLDSRIFSIEKTLYFTVKEEV